MVILETYEEISNSIQEMVSHFDAIDEDDLNSLIADLDTVVSTIDIMGWEIETDRGTMTVTSILSDLRAAGESRDSTSCREAIAMLHVYIQTLEISLFNFREGLVALMRSLDR
ncbi:MAG: hypothetical protein AAGL69_12465 [Pseudomonadota bacterium]